MASIYHLLDKLPAIDYYDMQGEYEALAQTLIASGKLRIDTDIYCNFARFSDPSINASFMVSDLELSNVNLRKSLTEKFKALYLRKYNDVDAEKKVKAAHINLQNQIQKLLSVPAETILKLTRLFVQATHPIVLKWLLLDRVEVFITYSHNIGDMMDIQNWQIAGSNSGMQSTDGREVAVFVSCGGDPFEEASSPKTTYGNGWPAIARLLIIAGQELGHFADIMRNNRGMQIDRHSSNFSLTQPKENVRFGRSNDLQACDKIYLKLFAAGLKSLIDVENALRFYAKNKIFSIKVFWLHFKAKYYRLKLTNFSKTDLKLRFIKRLMLDKYPALLIQAMYHDMKFNLAPIADVYKRADPDAEEAIACAEALARVPQQVNKWGHLATLAFMENLYHIYYNQVIPSLIHNYEALTGEKYIRDLRKPKKTIKYYFTRLFRRLEKRIIPMREPD